MKRSALLLTLAVLCAGCGAAKKVVFTGQAIVPPIPAPSFALRNDRNQLERFAAKSDHYTVITFLYTHCPDVCPIIAGNLNRALQTATAKSARLQVVAISVDPKGDTAAAVRTYVAERQLLPTFHYLIGTWAQLSPVWKDFHIAAVPGIKGTVTHDAFEILVDPAGQERLIYGKDVQPGWIVHDLALLTKEH